MGTLKTTSELTARAPWKPSTLGTVRVGGYLQTEPRSRQPGMAQVCMYVYVCIRMHRYLSAHTHMLILINVKYVVCARTCVCECVCACAIAWARACLGLLLSRYVSVSVSVPEMRDLPADSNHYRQHTDCVLTYWCASTFHFYLWPAHSALCQKITKTLKYGKKTILKTKRAVPHGRHGGRHVRRERHFQPSQ